MQNTVDVSPERVNAEWLAIEQEYNLDLNSQAQTEINQVIEAKTSQESTQESDFRASASSGISGVLHTVFSVVFTVFYQSWKITETEINELSEVWSAFVAKHTPPQYLAWFSGRASGDGFGIEVEFNAIATTIRIIKPRINMHKKPAIIKGSKEAENTEKNNTNPFGAGVGE